MSAPCKRSNGTFRAFFSTQEKAIAFANEPANWPVYRGDIAHLCHKCGYWHLSQPNWLSVPFVNAQPMLKVN
jgi:hypothetical protein